MTGPINSSSAVSPPVVGSAESSNGNEVSSVRQTVAVGGNGLPAEQTRERAEPSAQELEQATQNIFDYVQNVSRSLDISVDGELGTTVIQVFDVETEEIVRQIPSEEVIRISRYLNQVQESVDANSAVPGVLLDSEG